VKYAASNNYDASCICVHRPLEITGFSELVHPISKAALTAVASPRTIELAKPKKPLGADK